MAKKNDFDLLVNFIDGNEFFITPFHDLYIYHHDSQLCICLSDGDNDFRFPFCYITSLVLTDSDGHSYTLSIRGS